MRGVRIFSWNTLLENFPLFPKLRILSVGNGFDIWYKNLKWFDVVTVSSMDEKLCKQVLLTKDQRIFPE